MSIDTILTYFERPFCFYTTNQGIECVGGSVEYVNEIAAISHKENNELFSSISMVPFSQIRENDFQTHHQDEPIISLIPRESFFITRDDFYTEISHMTFEPRDVSHNMSDSEFCQAVQMIIESEIFNGEGCNFLLSRKTFVDLDTLSPPLLLTIFKSLLQNDKGAYKTFLFFDGTQYFIGASPERHITYSNGCVKMNPICGTLPKVRLTCEQDLIQFVTDHKEIYELFQVVDESLKIMSKICRQGGKIVGPFLKEMSALIHTEYYLEGQSDLPVLDLFRQTMFAPTMVGSPLKNAARIIKKYESESRGYYSSCLLFLGYDHLKQPLLDSAITIRTAAISKNGRCTLQSGASIVRDSVPKTELLEIESKIKSLLDALSGQRRPSILLSSYMSKTVQSELIHRNQSLSPFWFDDQSKHQTPTLNKTVCIVDNEDQFSYMLAHMVRVLGYSVQLVSVLDVSLSQLDSYDLVILGPGPGQPDDMNDRRVQLLSQTIDFLMQHKRPFLGVCLGHQVTCRQLGISLRRLERPIQGVQKVVHLFGRAEYVGFYNSFVAVSKPNDASLSALQITHDDMSHIVSVQGSHFMTIQFHVESILTQNGNYILKNMIENVL